MALVALPSVARAAPAPLRIRLRGLRDGIAAGLVEREEPARLVLLAALAGEHVLLLGPPGTAKSELARRLRGTVRGATCFERLLTRFTVPEELFGPLSIRALEQDRYHRLTEAYLPSASVAFLDEIFKANSAILNALLTLLNEREFDNGAERVKVPLVCVVAASNELPDGEELRALYDRFLLRCEVTPVSAAGFERLLDVADAPASLQALALDRDELEHLRRDAEAVRLPSPVRSFLAGLRAFLGERKIYVSDRRWRRIAALLRVAAYTDGRAEVSLWDCTLAVHCAWERPEQRSVVEGWCRDHLAAAARAETERYARLVDAMARTLEDEGRSVSPRRNSAGEALFVDPAGHVVLERQSLRPKTDALGECLYLRPVANDLDPSGDRSRGGRGYTVRELWTEFFMGDLAGLEAHLADPAQVLLVEVALEALVQPTRYTRAHIDARVAQLDALATDLDTFLGGLVAHAGALGADDPLWLAPDETIAVRATLAATLARLRTLAEGLEVLRGGFRALPEVEP